MSKENNIEEKVDLLRLQINMLIFDTFILESHKGEKCNLKIEPYYQYSTDGKDNIKIKIEGEITLNTDRLK